MHGVGWATTRAIAELVSDGLLAASPALYTPDMKLLLVLSCANGLVAVLLGAFGAHGLKARLGGLSDGPARLE